jgi:phosphatidylglycerophosphate synthase
MPIEIERKVEKASGTSLDSPIIDRYIIRKISGFITGFLIRTPVTPNQVTIISLILGIIAGIFFSFGGHTHTITAGLIFFLCVVFDQCDGEVARIKHMESEFGRAFDIIVDSIVNAVIVAGITLTLYKTSGSGFIIIIGILAITGISISILLAPYFGHENKKDTGTKAILDKLNNKDFFYIIMFASVIFNQMIWFLLIMAVGTNIYWIVHKIAHRKIAT